jgi:hypothetical protein
MSPPAEPETPEAVALVTAALARTAYVEDVPKFKGASAALAVLGKKPTNSTAERLVTAKNLSVECGLNVLLIFFRF